MILKDGDVLKLLSLFSGIGAFEKALTNIGVDYELVGFSEIDKWAIQSYCAIHGVDKNKNLGDVSKITNEQIKELGSIDLITHGSPCQDFSEVGTRCGGDKGSGTRSSLMWETVRIVEQSKPKYVIWENVKGVLYKNNRHNFDKYLFKMAQMGYKNNYYVLNSLNYGVPQNRERVFVISSTNKDIDLNKLTEKQFKPITTILDSNNQINYLNQQTQQHLFKNKNKQIMELYDVGASRGRFDKIQNKNIQRFEINKQGVANTITSVLKDNIIFDVSGLRYFTPLEYWRLMGFDDGDYFKVRGIGTPNTQLYKLASNSIVVPVVEEIVDKIVN